VHSGPLSLYLRFGWSPAFLFPRSHRSSWHEHRCYPYFLRHTTGPEINSYPCFSPFPCYLVSLSFTITSLDPRGQVRCRVLAQVTAFHASPCKYPDYFPIIDWSVPFRSTPDRANVGVLRFLHFLVMVSFFYFHIPRSRTGEHPFIYYSLRYATPGTSFGHQTVALDRLVITPSRIPHVTEANQGSDIFFSPFH